MSGNASALGRALDWLAGLSGDRRGFRGVETRADRRSDDRRSAAHAARPLVAVGNPKMADPPPGQARVLVLWERALHLSVEEEEAWTRQQVARIVAARKAGASRLCRLTPACREHPQQYAWLLELYLAAGETAEDTVRAPSVAELLEDLRQLRLCPAVLAAGPPVDPVA